jgi:hypothetical protein
MNPVSISCVSLGVSTRIVFVDPDRVRVAAGVAGRLEQRDLVPVVQQVRRDQPRHAGADDRDPHRCLGKSM